jgi:peptide/nickel transport system substrate-binding protein
MIKLQAQTTTSYFRYYLGLLCLATLLSCKNKDTGSKDHLVFRYNEHKNTTSLDPAFARNPENIWPINQLFNSLLQMDSNLIAKPDIAKNWTVGENGLQYTFNLRSDVYFHKSPLFGADSTRQVVADDFVYSFDRLRDPKVASPGSWVLNNVDTYEATNDSTFTVVLKKPFPAFLGLMTMQYCAVVPKEVAAHYGTDFRSNPIGTGPFYFKLWKENVKLVLRRNINYHEVDAKGNALPYLEAVAITFLPDKQSEFLQFAQGNLDFLNSIDNSYKDEILTADGDLRERYAANIKMLKGPYLNTEFLGFYLESASTTVNSIKIRKAMNYGFDRQKMITYLRNGIGFPAYNGFIPKGMPGFAEIEGYSYQPEKAARLITEYKAETGDLNPSITIATNSQYLAICEYIQRELGKLGLDVKVDVMPAVTLRQAKRTGKLDIFRGSWVADYPDPENYLSVFYSKNFTPGGPNYYHYKNEEFDRMFEKSFTISDTKEREALYTKMDSMILDYAPIVPLYYDEVVRFTNKKVSGLGMNPINLLILKNVKKTK